MPLSSSLVATTRTEFFCLSTQAFYFSRDDVALPGFAHFFKENSDEEREHADKLLFFQNKRGGRIFLQDIKKPDRDEWGNGLEAMQCALQLEKNVNQALLDLHKIASNKVDPHVSNGGTAHHMYVSHRIQVLQQMHTIHNSANA
uniref:Ferritin n=1 Tax=Hucho hucho TaxID=62062 RepID=A0A4W5PER4_9TELE